MMSIRSGEKLDCFSEYLRYNIQNVEEDGLLKKSESVGIRNVRYRISHMTGGTMEIKSTPGKGTTVTIHIPEEPLPDREEKRGEPCI